MLEKFKAQEIAHPEKIVGGTSLEGTQGQVIKSDFNRQTFRLNE
jgi:hypothetical protein